jgi:hypothetical protein
MEITGELKAILNRIAETYAQKVEGLSLKKERKAMIWTILGRSII